MNTLEQAANRIGEHVITFLRREWAARDGEILQALIEKQEKIMDDLSALTNDVHTLISENASLKTQVADLQGQLSNQSSVQPAIDALDAEVKTALGQ